MKKRFLYFAIILCIMFSNLFLFVGCGNNPNNDDSPPENEDGGSVNNEISTMYDMRVLSTHANENSALAFGHNTIVALPDGKYMVIDLNVGGEDEFMTFANDYMYFTGYKHTSGKYIIDYLVATNPYGLSLNSQFFDIFEVKNFYRPNMEIDLENWFDAMEIMGDEFLPKLDDYSKEIIKSLPAELLTGYKKQYYEYCGHPWGVETNRKNAFCYSYQYNSQYLLDLYDLYQSGCNIIKTTSSSDITNTFIYQGNSYSYTIDFFVPEPVITPSSTVLIEMLEFYPSSYNPDIGSWKYSDEPKYYIDSASNFVQDYEFRTIVSIKYSDFDFLYLEMPTYNVFDSFLKHHDPSKKYDMLVASYYDSGCEGNLNQVWLDIMRSYKDDGKYIPSLLFDVDKIDTNYFVIRQVADSNSNWGNKATSLYKMIYNENYAEELVVTIENTTIPRRRIGSSAYIDVLLPLITVQKNGLFEVKEIFDDGYQINNVYEELYPSIDGVLINP